VADLAREQERTAKAYKQHMNMKFPKLSNLFSGEAWSKVLEVMSADGLASLEASEEKVATMEATIAQLNAEKESAAAQVAALNASVAEKESQISELNTKLEATPAGNATTVVADQDHEPDGEPAKLTSWEMKAKQVNDFRTARAGKKKQFNPNK
jgi:prophage tail gpP-like protein